MYLDASSCYSNVEKRGKQSYNNIDLDKRNNIVSELYSLMKFSVRRLR